MSPKFAVHPAADIFPMMTADELGELAIDIAENGQRLPIMLDCEGKLLIDGRNRLEACKLASVEPVFDRLAVGEDLLAYIASANLMRRNLNKGQQAMALAMMYPEDKRGRGNKSEAIKSAETSDFSQRRLRQAREVLRYSRGLAEEVLKNTRSLDEALQQIHQEQGAARSRQSQIEELAAMSTDLVDMVNEGRMKFDQAMAEYHRRMLEQQRIRESVTQAFDGLSRFPGYVTGLRQAVDAGADNPLNDKLMKLIHDNVALLDKVWQEAKQNGKAK